MQRYIVNGIKPHALIRRAAEAKPWESEKVFDTMIQFAGVGNRISLDKLCLALSVPSPKGDMDGSMVSKAVADGRINEVAQYCKKDVEATREVFKRMTFQC
jgi:predicted PolB exonuclease-like 3'-5' exonuclease